MKINFTKKQYENLIEMIYIGNWIANAQRLPDEQIKKYEQIENYIFSFARDFGMGKFVDYEEKDGDKYYPTRMFEEETDVQKLLEEYDDKNFWDEAVERFGDRDFLRKYGKEVIKKMDNEERFIKNTECQEIYENEFNENGIDRIGIKE